MSEQSASVYGQVRIEGFDTFSREVFHKPSIRKAMRRAAAVVSRDAKRRVSPRGTSHPGAYPGRETGRLRKSIRIRISKSGFLAKVEPSKRPDMDEYYPAYLFHGTKRGIQPRGNYMADALQANQSEVQRIISAGVKDAIK